MESNTNKFECYGYDSLTDYLMSMNDEVYGRLIEDGRKEFMEDWEEYILDYNDEII